MRSEADTRAIGTSLQSFTASDMSQFQLDDDEGNDERTLTIVCKRDFYENYRIISYGMTECLA